VVGATLSMGTPSDAPDEHATRTIVSPATATAAAAIVGTALAAGRLVRSNTGVSPPSPALADKSGSLRTDRICGRGQSGPANRTKHWP
jgi:hypothetical protein